MKRVLSYTALMQCYSRGESLTDFTPESCQAPDLCGHNKRVVVEVSKAYSACNYIIYTPVVSLNYVYIVSTYIVSVVLCHYDNVYTNYSVYSTVQCL